MPNDKKFRKWHWIEAYIEKSPKDRRPESHRIFIDTINPEEMALSTKNNWAERRKILSRLKIYDDFLQIEENRQSNSNTLALLRPERLLGLDITASAEQEWTPTQLENLEQMQRQGNLFRDEEDYNVKTLKKIPFDFHYRYICKTKDGEKEYRHKIVDWEAGALFWNVYKNNKENWQNLFKQKLLHDFSNCDLQFLMGTMHRFPKQWLIVSLIYPPKQHEQTSRQGRLF